MNPSNITPFEQWMRDHVYGKLAPSSEIKELMARAFEGGQKANYEWQSLSYEEILRLEGLDCVDEEYIKRFARAVEQALMEKNK